MTEPFESELLNWMLVFGLFGFVLLSIVALLMAMTPEAREERVSRRFDYDKFQDELDQEFGSLSK